MLSREKIVFWMRVLCSLLLIAFGVRYCIFEMPSILLGAPLLVIGLAVAGQCCYQGIRDWKNRPDPYDLNLLNHTSPYRGASRDDPAEEPTKIAEADDDVICLRCHISLPGHYSLCPQCGVVLGH